MVELDATLRPEACLAQSIKIYSDHMGLTNQIRKLQEGNELALNDVWGAITYQGKGALLQMVQVKNNLFQYPGSWRRIINLRTKTDIFKQTPDDIIFRSEFERMLGNDFINVLTREKVMGYLDKRIDEDLLKSTFKNFGQRFYGPEAGTKSIQEILVNLDAKTETVVIEK